MPAEEAPHKRTWMAFGANASIWGKKLLLPVQRALAAIANTIVKYEPVTMLVRSEELAQARSLLDEAVQLQPSPLDDLWIRDTGPVFVFDKKNNKRALGFNFNGWGEKQPFSSDAAVAHRVAALAGEPFCKTTLTLEGGALEVDGSGTAIITESSVLNSNRNPGLSKAAFEAELMPLLGLQKIIWLPGIRGREITDGHVDFYARFVRPGVVLAHVETDPNQFDYAVTKKQLSLLRAATDASGRPLQVVPLYAPAKLRSRYLSAAFAASYLGFYVCNKAVLLQEFGALKRDAAAEKTLRQFFPGRAIEPLNLDAIAAGGGTLHCATMQEPR